MLRVVETRRTNLRTLINEWGGTSALARRLGYAGPSYLSQLTSGHRPISEKTARRVEATLHLADGWMDFEHRIDTPTEPGVGFAPQVVATATRRRGRRNVQKQTG